MIHFEKTALSLAVTEATNLEISSALASPQPVNAIITVIGDRHHPLGKCFALNSDGTVSKNASVNVSLGVAKMHRVDTPEQFAALLEKVGNDPHAAIINASFKGIEVGERFLILSANELAERTGIAATDRERQKGVHPVTYNGKPYKAVCRFKENVEPSCWQLFDRDIDKHTPAQFADMTPAQWVQAVDKIVPGFANVTYCHVPSTSSRVLKDGKPVGGGNGHVWVKFNNPGDLERFRTATMVCAAQADMTWLKSRYSRKEPGTVVGQSLCTIIDPSVFTPGRFVFVGKPVVKDGLTVLPLTAVIHTGTTDALDTTATVLPAPEVIRAVTRKAGAEMDVRSTGTGLRISANDLSLDTEVETKSHGNKTVRELLALGIKGKIRCQTPFRDSSSFAAFYDVNADGKPYVYDSGTSTTHWISEFDGDVDASKPARGNIASAVPTAAVNAPEVTDADCSETLALNSRFAFIEQHASIYRLEFGNFIEAPKFRLQHDNRKVNVTSGARIKSIGLGSAWLGSSKRRQHKALVLRPSEGEITSDNCLNEWQGFVVEPAPGDIKPFLRLLIRLAPNRAARRYIQKWAAHLVQRPGIKMFVSLALWSHAQGVGKNLLFETLVAIIGQTHATVIGQEELGSNFNGWANRRILIIGDEVSGGDKRQQNDKLKGLITGTAVHVNEKFQPDLEQPNLLNFVFLSNHHDALFVNDHDRRFFVWEIEAGRLPEKQANEFVAWRDSGGLAAVHHFLLHYPLGDFNPRAPAPMTIAKQQMADDNRSDLEAWIAELLASDVAKVFGRELATAKELGRRYAFDTGHSAPSSKAIVGAAKRMGVYARPSQVRLEDDKKVRALALTRITFWKQQGESEWAKEMIKRLAHVEL